MESNAIENLMRRVRELPVLTQKELEEYFNEIADKTDATCGQDEIFREQMKVVFFGAFLFGYQSGRVDVLYKKTRELMAAVRGLK